MPGVHCDWAPMKIDREWLKKKSTITLKHEYEDDLDWRKEMEGSPDTIRWIESELSMGNMWAWCRVTIIVAFQTFEERDHIGSCSYQNEQEFKAPGGYYDDMVDECIDKIADAFEELFNTHELWEHEKKTCMMCIADEASA